MGAMGKSAQFLLHTWLPDAMEGPTPVSALIHAATMVTAGVFMVARLSPMFEASRRRAERRVRSSARITAFFAATVGLVQNDIKRVIAYSTCSQLGYMFVALGAGVYSAGIFHLFTHAFFKALLFLGAGSVIHAMHHEQDMRNMGGLRKKIPITYCDDADRHAGADRRRHSGHAARLCGLLLQGRHHRERLCVGAQRLGTYAFPSGCWSSRRCFTSFYSWRLIFMTFHGETARRPPSRPWTTPTKRRMVVMLIPLFVLAAWRCLRRHALPRTSSSAKVTSDFWQRARCSGCRASTSGTRMHEVPDWVLLAPTLAMLRRFRGRLACSTSSLAARPAGASSPRAFRPLYLFFLNKWYFDELYDFIFVRPAIASAASSGRGVDGCGDRRHASTASRRGCPRRHRPGRQTANRLRVSLRLRHADRRRRALTYFIA